MQVQLRVRVLEPKQEALCFYNPNSYGRTEVIRWLLRATSLKYNRQLHLELRLRAMSHHAKLTRMYTCWYCDQLKYTLFHHSNLEAHVSV